MVKIQAEVNGYLGEREEIRRKWISRAIISISVIRVRQCSRQVSGSAISVPDRCLVLL